MRDPLRVIADHYWAERGDRLLASLIRIPAVSPAFDPGWRQTGFLDEALAAVRQAAGELEAVQTDPADGPPALLLRFDGTAGGEVLFYGHVDKQPPHEGWDDGLGPWDPVRRGDRLYGRGSTDDGYAPCAWLGALETVRRAGRSCPRVSLLLESEEESGSVTLGRHLETLADRLGRPRLVVVLDSEAGDYDRLWTTTSLRGTIAGTLSVQVLQESAHSGGAGGIVPPAFGILRRLLDRLDDPATGEVVEILSVAVPRHRLDEAARTATILGGAVAGKFPWVEGVRALSDDPATLLIDNTWRGSVAVVGAAGLPAIEAGGATHLPGVAVKLVIRIPPTLPAARAATRLKAELEREPPSGARVRFDVESVADGWDAPPLPDWLESAVDRASRTHYGHPAASMGTGGTIPVVELLGRRFPEASFLVTGVAGPHSNCHAPNESVHLPAVRALTASLAEIIAAAGAPGRSAPVS